MKNYDITEKIKNRYNRYSKFYDLMETPMEFFSGRWRKDLIKYSNGKVLEVGVGTGKNIKHYPENTDLTAIDFSKGMISKAIKKYGNKKNISFRQSDIQRTDFEDNTFDTVLASYVFCSVPDPVRGLEEVRRICKEGGRIVLLEHGRSEHKLISYLMDLFNPLTVNLFGYNINRDTESNLLKAGFRSYRIDYLRSDIFKMFIIENIK